MKIGLRLGLSFGVIIVLLVVLVYSAISSLSGLNSEVNNMAHDKFPKTVWANNVVDAINEGARALRNAALTKDIGERDKQIERTLATTPPVVMYLDSLKRTVKSE